MPQTNSLDRVMMRRLGGAEDGASATAVTNVGLARDMESAQIYAALNNFTDGKFAKAA